ncbi:MAG: hypothetical protein OHK0017_05260 [Patescibacteria group bacterium]
MTPDSLDSFRNVKHIDQKRQEVWVQYQNQVVELQKLIEQQSQTDQAFKVDFISIDDLLKLSNAKKFNIKNLQESLYIPINQFSTIRIQCVDGGLPLANKLLQGGNECGIDDDHTLVICTPGSRALERHRRAFEKAVLLLALKIPGITKIQVTSHEECGAVMAKLIQRYGSVTHEEANREAVGSAGDLAQDLNEFLNLFGPILFSNNYRNIEIEESGLITLNSMSRKEGIHPEFYTFLRRMNLDSENPRNTIPHTSNVVELLGVKGFGLADIGNPFDVAQSAALTANIAINGPEGMGAKFITPENPFIFFIETPTLNDSITYIRDTKLRISTALKEFIISEDLVKFIGVKSY